MSSMSVFLSISGHYTITVGRLRLYSREHLLVAGHDALGVTESARALAVRADIEYDVVGTLGIARNSANSGKMIQAQVLAQAPRDEVIRAGGIAADAYPADHFLAGGE